MEQRKFEFPMPFNIGEIGRSMEEMACDLIKLEKNSVVTRWYRSGRDVNFYVWEDSKSNVIKQHMNICGQVIEWNIIEGVKTGLICDEGDEVIIPQEGVQIPENIVYDDDPSKTSIGQAKQLIEQMGILEEQAKKDLINNFTNSPSADSMDPEQFLKVYGHNLPKSTKSPMKELFLKLFDKIGFKI